MTCQQVVEIITDYLDGALDAVVREELERHLMVCPGCAAYLDQMRLTVRLTGSLTAEQVPKDMMSILLDAFRGVVR